jgi:hypothetical protein
MFPVKVANGYPACHGQGRPNVVFSSSATQRNEVFNRFRLSQPEWSGTAEFENAL